MRSIEISRTIWQDRHSNGMSCTTSSGREPLDFASAIRGLGRGQHLHHVPPIAGLPFRGLNEGNRPGFFGYLCAYEFVLTRVLRKCAKRTIGGVLQRARQISHITRERRLLKSLRVACASEHPVPFGLTFLPSRLITVRLAALCGAQTGAVNAPPAESQALWWTDKRDWRTYSPSSPELQERSLATRGCLCTNRRSKEYLVPNRTLARS